MSDTAKPELLLARLGSTGSPADGLYDFGGCGSRISACFTWPLCRSVASFASCCAAVALYWAGMILNDVFDIEQDRMQRPSRPLPAGDISMQSAIARAGDCSSWV